MSFFRRAELTVRCACRGATLTVPDRDALLDACEPGQRRRLQRSMAKQPDGAPSWSVYWGKSAGDALRPHDIVAVLRHDGVSVELFYTQKGNLAEMLVPQSARVAAGARLARLERRARSGATPTRSTNDLLREFVSRQRQEAELIAALRAELAANQYLVGRLRGEIAALQARRGAGERGIPDPKFTRLKHEFSKCYHPDARPLGDAERARRARVFQEFWPVVEEIERS